MVINESFLYFRIRASNSVAKSFLLFHRKNYDRHQIIGAYAKRPSMLVIGEDESWCMFVLNNPLLAYPLVKYLVRGWFALAIKSTYKIRLKLPGRIEWLPAGDVAMYYVTGHDEVFV